MKKWVIYKITNPCGRVYIGKSCNYKQRLRCYKCIRLKDQNLIAGSLKKYGFEDHKFEVIDQFESDGFFAQGKEMFWIRSYMSNFIKWPVQKGLNLTDGGDGTLGYKKSDEERKAMSERNKGKKQSAEQRLKTSIQHVGNKYNLGRKASEATKRKMAERRTGKKIEGEWLEKIKRNNIRLRGKRVIQLSSDMSVVMEFESVISASLHFMVNRETLKRWLSSNENRNEKGRGIILKYK